MSVHVKVCLLMIAHNERREAICKIIDIETRRLRLTGLRLVLWCTRFALGLVNLCGRGLITRVRQDPESNRCIRHTTVR